MFAADLDVGCWTLSVERFLTLVVIGPESVASFLRRAMAPE